MKDAEDLLDLKLSIVVLVITGLVIITIQSALCTINTDNCAVVDGRWYNWIVETIRSIADWYSNDKTSWLLSAQDWMVSLLPKPQIITGWFWRVIVPGLPS